MPIKTELTDREKAIFNTRMAEQEVAEAIAAEAAGKEEGGGDLLSILDNSVPKVIAALADLATEELEQLKQAEVAGNTRKGVIDALDAAIESRKGGV